jgi:raffinose/stachyose/melibiose transport system substrate-binding protein
MIKVLHVNPISKVQEIWRAAALEYERANPRVKVQFDYLENEVFKATLPALLQSKGHPSVFHSWGGGVMLEQIQAGFCQDITFGCGAFAQLDEEPTRSNPLLSKPVGSIAEPAGLRGSL